MKTFVYADYDQLSRAAATLVTDTVRSNPHALLCIATGDTPAGMMNYLTEDVRSGVVDFSKVSFVSLDEWVGLNQQDEGSCRHFFYQHLVYPLNLNAEQVAFFDGRADDAEHECARIDQYITGKGGIELMIVGIGMNGHIGMNEPGLAVANSSHIVNLDEVTITVGQKYFREKTPLRRGITLGIGQILESKKAILMASGRKKAEIVARAATGPVTTQVPASFLQQHHDAYMLLDADAASSLDYTIA